MIDHSAEQMRGAKNMGWHARIDRFLDGKYQVSYYTKGSAGEPAVTDRLYSAIWPTRTEAYAAGDAWAKKWADLNAEEAGQTGRATFRVEAFEVDAEEPDPAPDRVVKPPISGPYVAICTYNPGGAEYYLGTGDMPVRDIARARFVSPDDFDRIERAIFEFGATLNRIVERDSAELDMDKKADPQVIAAHGWALGELEHIERYVEEAGLPELDPLDLVLCDAISKVKEMLAGHIEGLRD